jgi:predicted amidophosphoribosyltransferase
VPKAPKCGECGAQLKLGPDCCPLCGAELSSEPKARKASDADTYQSNVRELREELRKLRSHDAEAV